MHLVPPYSSMFAWVLFSFADVSSLMRLICPTNNNNRQEDEDLNYVDVPKGDDNEGKSQLPTLPSCFKTPKMLKLDYETITVENELS